VTNGERRTYPTRFTRPIAGIRYVQELFTGVTRRGPESPNRTPDLRNFALQFRSMNTQATRHELIEWINKLEDPGLLGSLLGIKKATQQGDRAADVSSEERQSIERGLEDLRQGRKVSSKDFWAEHGR
jgi:hypothetical protein